ncbi:hypothetical protein NDU88_001786 [Pleurodeles waltl]|uniref:Uncharacterized protein n=1 Tax=Pleurodeles waltl TaxID=8319 RepID=A0AAV7UVP7_PLEWA|nr:hypothetical protein NDU88_001786 [Pleurodeles waltl]
MLGGRGRQAPAKNRGLSSGRPIFGPNRPRGGAPLIRAAPTAPATAGGTPPRRPHAAHRAQSNQPGPTSPRPSGRRRGRSSVRRPRTGARGATGPPPTHGVKDAPATLGRVVRDPAVSRRVSGPRGKPVQAAGRLAAQQGRGRRHTPFSVPG